MEKQAWIRFALGALTLISIAVGAGAKFSNTEERTIRNESGIVEANRNIAGLKDDVHGLELQDKETMIRQQQIMSTLGRIETKIDTFEVVN